MSESEILRIGLILTKPGAEKKKDELVCIGDRNRPWLPKNINIPQKLSCDRDGSRWIAGDVSIGKYIEYAWNNVEVDYILPGEITEERLNKNCINFMLIYDILESFHIDKTSGKTQFEALKKVLFETKNVNIYPPRDYQEFINNKCSYITKLKKKSKSVIPTKCFMYNKYKNNKNFSSEICESIKKYCKEQGWGGFIGKPVYGQESIDFKIFKDGVDTKDEILKKYIKHCFDEKKYPGIIFQKFIEGFDKESPEIRLYYFGDKYQYSVITTDTTVNLPKQENGSMVVPDSKFGELKSYSKSVLKSLPQIKMHGVNLDKLLTRIDIACGPNFDKPWYVNEVEFVPSLYIEDINKIPEPGLGDKIIDITLKFIKGSRYFKYN